MLSIRQDVNSEILRYMESEGYHLAPGSKTPHTLDSWVFHYTNAAGNNDGVKIEINYSDRCHILPAVETHVSIPFLSDVKVRSLSPVELFATKINALIGRSAARDIYDVYNMVRHQLFVSDEERTLLRKATVFYLTVGSSRKDNATPTLFLYSYSLLFYDFDCKINKKSPNIIAVEDSGIICRQIANPIRASDCWEF